ncbi:hypothetical protein [Methylocystis parvus]|jgi:hypothetical protein|uniref:hypothetical protein n=1 Tax=Methylocystis parvus TaxID=134 RepID=UPI003C793B6D
MRALLSISTFLAFFAVAPAMAQGTEAQKAACERDAERLCSDAIPDAIAVEKCLAANMRSLSAACRRQFKPRR